MGKARIILRPTPMTRKVTGQMMKIFGLWDNTKHRIRQRETNTRSCEIDGQPKFLANVGVRTGFVTRRQIVMNRHFTEIISDILSNSVEKELSDLGVTITSIETKAWNKGVSIFYSTDKEFSMQLHDELEKLTSRLRRGITERQLIGRTPSVHFVYDEIRELDRNLEAALQTCRTDPDDSHDLANLSSDNMLNISERKNYKSCRNEADGRFSAPHDMTNNTLGLDYPSLYDEVASKLGRGRAQSARITPDSTTVVSTDPFNLRPIGTTSYEEGLDPVSRLQQMQKFLVSQKKKREYLSKIRRKKELLHRDSYRWDVPEEEEEPYDDRGIPEEES